MGEPQRVEGRERWRVALPPVDAELPLHGFIVLGWAEELRVRRIGTREVLACLAANRTWRGVSDDPVRLLDLATLPVLALHRPQDWSSLTPAMALLEAAIATWSPPDGKPSC